MARVGCAKEEGVIVGACKTVKATVVLDVCRQPVNFRVLPEVQLSCNLPVSTAYTLVVVHIDEEEGRTELVGAEHLDSRGEYCTAVSLVLAVERLVGVTAKIVVELHILCFCRKNCKN